MRSLLYTPLDPASRFIRLLLSEKKLDARLVHTDPHRDEGDLATNNPALTIPVLIDESPSGKEISICPSNAIVEYLEEVYNDIAFFPAASAERAEIRRLCAWFSEKFEAEVNAKTLRIRLAPGGRAPLDPDDLRTTADALCWHLDYLSWLMENRAWLAGEVITLADFCGAAYLSSIDYLGLVPWRDFPHVKEWYSRLKSRPSFRPLLADRLDSVPPPPHYENLDF